MISASVRNVALFVVVAQSVFVTNMIAFDKWNLIAFDKWNLMTFYTRNFDCYPSFLLIALFIVSKFFSFSMRATMDSMRFLIVALMLSFTTKQRMPSLYSQVFCTSIYLEKISCPRFLLDFVDVQKDLKRKDLITFPEKIRYFTNIALY